MNDGPATILSALSLVVASLSLTVSYHVATKSEEFVTTSISDVDLKFSDGLDGLVMAAHAVVYNGSREAVILKGGHLLWGSPDRDVLAQFGTTRREPGTNCEPNSFGRNYRLESRGLAEFEFRCVLKAEDQVIKRMAEFIKAGSKPNPIDFLAYLYEADGIDYAGNVLPVGLGGYPFRVFSGSTRGFFEQYGIVGLDIAVRVETQEGNEFGSTSGFVLSANSFGL